MYFGKKQLISIPVASGPISMAYFNHPLDVFFLEIISLYPCSVKSLLLLFSWYVVSDSLWPHELQYARLLCPSLSPRVCTNSCPLNWWCHPAISSSVTLFFSWEPSFWRIFRTKKRVEFLWGKWTRKEDFPETGWRFMNFKNTGDPHSIPWQDL